VFTGINLRAASNISLSFQPSYNYTTAARQYVNAFDDATATDFYGRRYLFADLKQKTLGLDTRMNITFSPTLTFELFAQPFISSVHFNRFKEFVAPRQQAVRVFGEDVGTVTPTFVDGRISSYAIDPDGNGPAPVMNQANPDFNTRSLRGNAVVRWEYRPGSTLFLVWTRTSSNLAQRVGNFDFGRDAEALLNADSDNIFLVKVNFWLNR
jgi:hypothetical protein